MTVISEFICTGVTLSLCLFLLRSLEAIPWPPRRAAVIGALGTWAVLWLASLLLNDRLVTALAAIPAAFFLSWYLGGIDPKKAGLFALFFGILRMIAYGAVSLLLPRLPLDAQDCIPLLDTAALYALICATAALSTRWRVSPAGLLWLLPVWSVEAVLCCEAVRFRAKGFGGGFALFCLLWLAYCGVLLFSTGNRMEKRVLAVLEKKQKQHHFALQEEYYRQLQEKQSETRALWHDLSKYLRAAKAEAPTAQALQQLESMMASATQIVDVGNPILNVILNEYDQLAKAAGIDLRLKVQVPETLPVSVADLYILIGNTMDNAIEACQTLPGDQRLIDLTLITHNDILYYKLVNPCNATASPRELNSMRGYGLQNVCRCVEKYHGTADLTKENGFFTVTTHLNLPV